MKSDKNLLKIDSLLKSSNASELKNANMVGVFVRNVGMTRSYKIYYETINGSIMEGYVNNDMLRSKNYILSFYMLIQKSLS